MVLSTEWDRADFLVVSLAPFAPEERAVILQNFPDHIYYMPGYERNKDFADTLRTELNYQGEARNAERSATAPKRVASGVRRTGTEYASAR